MDELIKLMPECALILSVDEQQNYVAPRNNGIFLRRYQ
jgi:hypothetical protein